MILYKGLHFTLLTLKTTLKHYCALITDPVFLEGTKRFNIYQIYFLREEEAIQLDGLNASQIRELREKSEKFAFQAEVNRMMKLIINSLYKNKEVSNMWLGSFFFSVW